MGTELQDTDLLAKLSGGDMATIKAKYHTHCMVSLMNRYRSSIRSSTDKTLDHHADMAKARAFAEIISHMENHCEASEYIFKLSHLHQLYTSHFVN